MSLICDLATQLSERTSVIEQQNEEIQKKKAKAKALVDAGKLAREQALKNVRDHSNDIESIASSVSKNRTPNGKVK